MAAPAGRRRPHVGTPLARFVTRTAPMHRSMSELPARPPPAQHGAQRVRLWEPHRHAPRRLL
eukprot:4771849-Pyramimonas_sp.AAC.1